MVNAAATAPPRRHGRASLALGLALFLIAFAARLGLVYASGRSVFDSTNYDPSVYYAAADALVHGRAPYAHFALLHPPLIAVALAPFAALGRATTDHTGYVIATLVWMGLGAANAVLVYAVARRLRLPSFAAATGALFYGVFVESLHSEYSTRLEPLGNAFVLCALLFWAGQRRARNAALCGAALAAATSVKIWYVLPLVVVLLWVLFERRGRVSVLAFVGAAAVTFAVVDGPFYVIAGRSMIRMVVLEQIGRGGANRSVVRRLRSLTGALQMRGSEPRWAVVTACGALVVVLGAAVVLAWRSRIGRLPAALLVVQSVLLLTAPSFFPFYSDYVMPAAAVTIACAAAAVVGRTREIRRSRMGVAAIPAALAIGLTLFIDLVRPDQTMTPAPDPALVRAVASLRCVQADSPMPLIQLDVLSKDLADHCPQWVDVTGRTYGADKPRPPQHRTSDPKWQHALRHYLTAGDAFLVVQAKETGISRRTERFLHRYPVLAADPESGYVVRRVVHRPGSAG